MNFGKGLIVQEKKENLTGRGDGSRDSVVLICCYRSTGSLGRSLTPVLNGYNQRTNKLTSHSLILER